MGHPDGTFEKNNYEAGEKDDKDDWQYKEGTGWVNSKTGEVWAGDKDTDLKKEGDWNKEDWAGWDKKDDDGAAALAASAFAALAASMAMF